MKNKIITFLLVLVFLSGLGLLLYPTVSNLWNSRHTSKVITQYSREVTNLDATSIQEMLEQAREYNRKLFREGRGFDLSDSENVRYKRLLNTDGNGIMGYVEIPKIRCKLPIYHGTEEESLVNGTGHLEWSSLPVGGESTHTVISGHRGVPSARLFTDIDRLVEGDVFSLHVLGITLNYEVDQILVVLPEELDTLKIEEGKDYCTLVTCTPYGVNTHRLLVRGHRVNTEEALLRMTADAYQISNIWVILLIFVPLFVLSFIGLYVIHRNGKAQDEAFVELQKLLKKYK